MKYTTHKANDNDFIIIYIYKTLNLSINDGNDLKYKVRLSNVDNIHYYKSDQAN